LVSEVTPSLNCRPGAASPIATPLGMVYQ